MSMSLESLEIHPYELRFLVEAKKQSSCTIQLLNKTDQYVAFKVKTTSPKKYCVRPNVGIIKPNGTCDFTVTMQVQRAAPVDLQCKDKFLVQSTVVPSETVEEDLTSDLFAKDSARHREEKKLRVILVPVNGVVNQDSLHDTIQKDKVPTAVEKFLPSQKISPEPEEAKIAKPREELRLASYPEKILPERTGELETIDSREVKNVEERPTPRTDMEELLKKELDEYRSKLDIVESKLSEAEHIAANLTDEKAKALQEKIMVKRELGFLLESN